MVLIDRLARDEGLQPGKRIGGHHEAIILLFLLGKGTRAQAITALGLDPGDETQLDALKTHYDGLTTTAQVEFAICFRGVVDLLSNGLITKAQAKTLLGL